jgi:hypothetical protein
MMLDRAAHLSRWRALVVDAALRALDAAESGTAAGASAAVGDDQETPSMMVAIPAARTLLDRTAVSVDALRQAWQQWSRRPPPRLPRDSAGHTRAVYGLLVEHLFQCALRLLGCAQVMPPPQRAHDRRDDDDADVSVVLWRALVNADDIHATVGPEVDRVLVGPQAIGPLHAFAESQMLIDVWWYRELVGLHALHGLALRMDRDDWRTRVRAATAYHLEHTQPDHTTAQPWALAAFASEPTTAIFAEQQLHDARSYWTQAREPGAALLPGLLLAHAAALLEAQGQVWRRGA